MMPSACQLCYNSRHTTEYHPCSVCKGFGHLPDHCDQNHHNTECELCGSSTHPTHEHICFSCNQTGLHRRRDCPQQPTDFRSGRCGFCKHQGHTSQEHECLLCKARGSHRTRDCTIYTQIGHRGRIMLLYQMRDNNSAISILQNKALIQESGNYGTGFYLYERTDLACERASTAQQAIIQVEVEVGRSLVVKGNGMNIPHNNQYLKDRNCESLCALGQAEYHDAVWVIYDASLIKKIYGLGKSIPKNHWPSAFRNLFSNNN